MMITFCLRLLRCSEINGQQVTELSVYSRSQEEEIPLFERQKDEIGTIDNHHSNDDSGNPAPSLTIEQNNTEKNSFLGQMEEMGLNDSDKERELPIKEPFKNESEMQNVHEIEDSLLSNNKDDNFDETGCKIEVNDEFLVTDEVSKESCYNDTEAQSNILDKKDTITLDENDDNSDNEYTKDVENVISLVSEENSIVNQQQEDLPICTFSAVNDITHEEEVVKDTLPVSSFEQEKVDDNKNQEKQPESFIEEIESTNSDIIDNSKKHTEYENIDMLPTNLLNLSVMEVSDEKQSSEQNYTIEDLILDQEEYMSENNGLSTKGCTSNIEELQQQNITINDGTQQNEPEKDFTGVLCVSQENLQEIPNELLDPNTLYNKDETILISNGTKEDENQYKDVMIDYDTLLSGIDKSKDLITEDEQTLINENINTPSDSSTKNEDIDIKKTNHNEFLSSLQDNTKDGDVSLIGSGIVTTEEDQDILLVASSGGTENSEIETNMDANINDNGDQNISNQQEVVKDDNDTLHRSTKHKDDTINIDNVLGKLFDVDVIVKKDGYSNDQERNPDIESESDIDIRQQKDDSENEETLRSDFNSEVTHDMDNSESLLNELTPEDLQLQHEKLTNENSEASKMINEVNIDTLQEKDNVTTNDTFNKGPEENIVNSIKKIRSLYNELSNEDLQSIHDELTSGHLTYHQADTNINQREENSINVETLQDEPKNKTINDLERMRFLLNELTSEDLQSIQDELTNMHLSKNENVSIGDNDIDQQNEVDNDDASTVNTDDENSDFKEVMQDPIQNSSQNDEYSIKGRYTEKYGSTPLASRFDKNPKKHKYVLTNYDNLVRGINKKVILGTDEKQYPPQELVTTNIHNLSGAVLNEKDIEVLNAYGFNEIHKNDQETPKEVVMVSESENKNIISDKNSTSELINIMLNQEDTKFNTESKPNETHRHRDDQDESIIVIQSVEESTDSEESERSLITEKHESTENKSDKELQSYEQRLVSQHNDLSDSEYEKYQKLNDLILAKQAENNELLLTKQTENNDLIWAKQFESNDLILAKQAENNQICDIKLSKDKEQRESIVEELIKVTKAPNPEYLENPCTSLSHELQNINQQTNSNAGLQSVNIFSPAINCSLDDFKIKVLNKLKSKNIVLNKNKESEKDMESLNIPDDAFNALIEAFYNNKVLIDKVNSEHDKEQSSDLPHNELKEIDEIQLASLIRTLFEVKFEIDDRQNDQATKYIKNFLKWMMSVTNISHLSKQGIEIETKLWDLYIEIYNYRVLTLQHQEMVKKLGNRDFEVRRLEIIYERFTEEMNLINEYSKDELQKRDAFYMERYDRTKQIFDDYLSTATVRNDNDIENEMLDYCRNMMLTSETESEMPSILVKTIVCNKNKNTGNVKEEDMKAVGIPTSSSNKAKSGVKTGAIKKQKLIKNEIDDPFIILNDDEIVSNSSKFENNGKEKKGRLSISNIKSSISRVANSIGASLGMDSKNKEKTEEPKSKKNKKDKSEKVVTLNKKDKKEIITKPIDKENIKIPMSPKQLLKAKKIEELGLNVKTTDLSSTTNGKMEVTSEKTHDDQNNEPHIGVNIKMQGNTKQIDELKQKSALKNVEIEDEVGTSLNSQETKTVNNNEDVSVQIHEVQKTTLHENSDTESADDLRINKESDTKVTNLNDKTETKISVESQINKEIHNLNDADKDVTVEVGEDKVVATERQGDIKVTYSSDNELNITNIDNHDNNTEAKDYKEQSSQENQKSIDVNLVFVDKEGDKDVKNSYENEKKNDLTHFNDTETKITMTNVNNEVQGISGHASQDRETPIITDENINILQKTHEDNQIEMTHNDKQYQSHSREISISNERENEIKVGVNPELYETKKAMYKQKIDVVLVQEHEKHIDDTEWQNNLIYSSSSDENKMQENDETKVELNMNSGSNASLHDKEKISHNEHLLVTEERNNVTERQNDPNNTEEADIKTNNLNDDDENKITYRIIGHVDRENEGNNNIETNGDVSVQGYNESNGNFEQNKQDNENMDTEKTSLIIDENNHIEPEINVNEIKDVHYERQNSDPIDTEKNDLVKEYKDVKNVTESRDNENYLSKLNTEQVISRDENNDNDIKYKESIGHSSQVTHETEFIDKNDDMLLGKNLIEENDVQVSSGDENKSDPNAEENYITGLNENDVQVSSGDENKSNPNTEKNYTKVLNENDVKSGSSRVSQENKKTSTKNINDELTEKEHKNNQGSFGEESQDESDTENAYTNEYNETEPKSRVSETKKKTVIEEKRGDKVKKEHENNQESSGEDTQFKSDIKNTLTKEYTETKAKNGESNASRDDETATTKEINDDTTVKRYEYQTNETNTRYGEKNQEDESDTEITYTKEHLVNEVKNGSSIASQDDEATMTNENNDKVTKKEHNNEQISTSKEVRDITNLTDDSDNESLTKIDDNEEIKNEAQSGSSNASQENQKTIEDELVQKHDEHKNDVQVRSGSAKQSGAKDQAKDLATEAALKKKADYDARQARKLRKKRLFEHLYKNARS